MVIDFKQYAKLLTKIKQLKSYVDVNANKYNLPEACGIYTFWYDNSDGIISKLKRNPIISGPNGVKEKILWDWHLENRFICLYVGKTRNVKKRVGQHLLLKTENLYPEKSEIIYKKTTACQLRAGFDFLYQDKVNINLKLELFERINLSFVRIEDFRERFYVEDFLIGHFLPWFNLDSER